jgi:hypothetical protein
MYARKTKVPIDRSKTEIEKLLKGAGGVQYFAGETDDADVVGCRLRDRFVRFNVPRPGKEWSDVARKKLRPGYQRQNFDADRAVRAEHSRRWRCLVVIVKAKLAAVDAGIRTFEQEFLGDIMMPDKRTVYDHIAQGLADAYASGKVGSQLLLGPGAS